MMMLLKCCTQYASKFGKLSSAHRTGKGQFSFQSQRKAMPKNVQSKESERSEVAQSFPTLCNPMASSIHGILQAIILEWVAMPFSRGSSWPRDQTQVSHIAGGFFTIWVPREAYSWLPPEMKATSLLSMEESDSSLKLHHYEIPLRIWGSDHLRHFNSV